jgi:hypothetical protein
MAEVSTFRLYLLRAMYLLLAVGLGLTIWPAIIAPPSVVANSSTVVRALLGALSLLCLLGLRYPLRKRRRNRGPGPAREMCSPCPNKRSGLAGTTYPVGEKLRKKQKRRHDYSQRLLCYY